MIARWNPLRRTVVLLALAFAGISLTGCNQPVGGANGAPANATAVKTTQQFAVEGMHCDGCARAIEAALAAVPGVKSATVSFDAKKATVVTEGRQVAAADIEKTVSDLGFKFQPLEPASASPASKP